MFFRDNVWRRITRNCVSVLTKTLSSNTSLRILLYFWRHFNTLRATSYVFLYQWLVLLTACSLGWFSDISWSEKSAHRKLNLLKMPKTMIIVKFSLVDLLHRGFMLIQHDFRVTLKQCFFIIKSTLITVDFIHAFFYLRVVV